MTTQKEIASSLNDAVQSTGPKTAKGKAVSRMNAIKHGVYSKELILRRGFIHEDPKEFRQLVDSLIADLQPVGTMETILAEKIAVSLWRLKRIYAAEIGHFLKELQQLKGSYGYPDEPDTEYVDPDEVIKTDEIEDMIEPSELADLPPEELQREPEFLEFLEERYPGKKLIQLSEHQLKRLRTAFRHQLSDMRLDIARIVHYQHLAIPMQQAVLVPDERMGQQETRLERSIMRDLAALKKLQEMRQANE